MILIIAAKSELMSDVTQKCNNLRKRRIKNKKTGKERERYTRCNNLRGTVERKGRKKKLGTERETTKKTDQRKPKLK